MKFLVDYLDSKSSFNSVTVFSVDDLLSTLSSLNPGISRYMLSQVDFFACSSLDRFFSSKKYNFCVQKVI